ncbi:hypothetical protein K4F85_07525 [Phaeobacter inhibens]|uniref:hypothetical protein n=1 Tax=Phaeobacter inhibens TaxID=221822 RepID=UPI0021A741FA|nr:hypothetical protein [Phaeobacter inhibens]UWR42712.1 hypothetical protein K4F85_07525 [Phaeobacter inhibens]
MSKVSQPLWAAGPGELLQHGISLLEQDTEANRRISMILIDNAVELILKTYLSLPERVTGLKLSRKQRDEYCGSFPGLLDGVEAHASARLIGLNLGEFEWFHRLRNELYHQGNGLTVERRNVEVYAELAEKLFESLFDCKLRFDAPQNSNTELIGEFFEDWIKIERNLAQAVEGGEKMPSLRAAELLYKKGELTRADLETLKQVQIIRNQLVHGEAEPEEMLRPSNMAKVRQSVEAIAEALSRAMAQISSGLH